MGIIAVSDVHLGYMKNKKESLSDTKNFISFLEDLAKRNDITHFVICGDLLDMWRRDMVGVTIEILHILEMIQDLQSKMEVLYLAGNHDYHICHLTKYNYPFGLMEGIDPKGGKKITEEGGKTYLFKHGYDFELLMKKCECFFDLLCSTSDEAGEFKSWLWDQLKLDPITKKLLSALLKTIEERMLMPENEIDPNPFIKSSLQKDEVLVFGHTHKPFHSQDKINLGSWIKYPEKMHNTYLEVIKDQERLLVWPTKEEIRKGPVPSKFSYTKREVAQMKEKRPRKQNQLLKK
jgi:UDP-2,3-diacylglucosamine pyrophosphatase LpxH